MTEPNDRKKKKLDFDKLEMLRGKPPLTGRDWLRRAVVTAVLLGSAAWAFGSCYSVLSRRQAPPPELKRAEENSTLPDSTGEYKFAAARDLYDGSQQMLRAGNLGGLEGLEEVVRLFPDSPHARQALMVIAASQRFQMQQPQRAFTTYRDFVKRYPDDRQLPRAIGALRDLSAELSVTDPSGRLLRGAREQVKDDPKALARVEKLLETK
jgi:hypothetical protein